MTRLPLLAALPLMLMLQGCDPHSSADIDEAIRNLEGHPLTPGQVEQVRTYLASTEPGFSEVAALAEAVKADMSSSSSASSSAEQVAYVPPPEECHVTAWREIFVDCHGFNVEGPER